MGQDATKVVMGVVGSSDRVISDEDSDPASFKAGVAVRRKTDGTLSTAVGDGELIGISLGESLSDTKKTAVCRAGNHVPIELAPYLVKKSLTLISKIGTALSIEFLDTGSNGSETATIANGVISVSMEDGVSTATHLKTALDRDVGDYIETQIAGGAGSTTQDAFAAAVINTLAQAVVGAAVRISDVTGKAILAGGSVTGACYISGALTGVRLDGSLPAAAKIDMGGGL